MLNILPLHRKTTLRRAYLTQQLQLLIGIAVVATSLAVVMVFVSDWVLQRWLNSATVATNADLISEDDRAELKTLVSTITLSVNQIQPLLAEPAQPLIDLQTLLAATPDTISLHSFTLTYTNQTLRLTGTAASRDDLVSYQQVLTGMAGISNVKLPLSDLNQKAAIPFTMTANYEPTQL